ncbi:fimbrial protein [Klebsiella aerogenes]|uniref:fimbrial protein n=1 Tax=Klebsiella aerogenes TaxID=548 RepID=UPI001F1D9698|nr:fimbrial protein [Klebsiella aerogenes]
MTAWYQPKKRLPLRLQELLSASGRGRRKTLLVGMLMATISSPATLSVAQAATCPGNVCNLKVHGTVTATSCDVDTSSRQLTVNLGNVSVGTFKSVGDVSNPEPFHIKLTDCSDNISGGSITFQGTPDTGNSDLLQLTPGSGVASGVGVQIMDGNGGAPIPLGQAVGTAPLTAGSNDLVYSLRYKSTQSAVTPGVANAVMYFDLSYQ